jgi:hypothetical protein
MSKLKPNTRYPTASEDAQISAAIATDPDNPELVFSHLEKAKSAADFFGPEKYSQVLAMKRAKDSERA